jgi:hypothetical protein
MPSIPIQPGDQFSQVEYTALIWIAETILERPNFPPHVRLTRADNPYRVITVSVSALLDKRLYRRVANT